MNSKAESPNLAHSIADREPQAALDYAQEQLGAIEHERENIRAKLEMSREKRKSVALGAFRQDAAALKTQKAARAEFEDLEFVLAEIDLALQTAQEEVARRRTDLQDHQLREIYAAIAVLCTRRTKLLKQILRLRDEMIAAFLEYRAVGEEISSTLAKSRMVRPRPYDALDVVSLAMSALGNDETNFAVWIKQCLPFEAHRAWPDYPCPPDDGIVDRETQYWENVVRKGCPTGLKAGDAQHLAAE